MQLKTAIHTQFVSQTTPFPPRQACLSEALVFGSLKARQSPEEPPDARRPIEREYAKTKKQGE